MRFSAVCAALAAASVACAQQPVTITKTVARVHQVSWPTSKPATNGTEPMTLHTGTGVWTSVPTSTPSVSPAMPTVQPATGGASSSIRLDTLGFIAAAGLAGLVAL